MPLYSSHAPYEYMTNKYIQYIKSVGRNYSRRLSIFPNPSSYFLSKPSSPKVFDERVPYLVTRYDQVSISIIPT